MTITQGQALAALIEAVEAGDNVAVQILAKRMASEARNGGASWPAYEIEKAMSRDDLNAAAALHEALLGWAIFTMRNNLGGPGFEVQMQSKAKAHADAICVDAVASTRARAWLLATLKGYAATRTDATPGAAG